MDYANKFAAAIERTRRFGLIAPATERRAESVLSATAQAGLSAAVRDWLSPPSQGTCASAQLELHYRLLGPLTAHLRVPACYTIGWAGDAECDEQALRQVLARSMSPSALPLRAWLTLPSMEIVDASRVRDVIAGHPADLDGARYHPMLVGVDFLWRIGAI